MKLQNLRTAALATCAIAAMPAMSHAANISAQGDVCVKAFVSSLSTKFAKAPTLRDSHIIDAAGVVPAEVYEFKLTATNPKDNRQVARAICTVSAQGQVLGMRPDTL
jgi:hypothetical protein